MISEVVRVLRDNKPVGYHVSEIPRGVLGASSKVMEELLELQDAEHQGVKLLQLCELADLYGAVRALLRERHPEVSMADLEAMADLTERAFASGARR